MMSEGAGSWTPADGPPSCGATAGIVVDFGLTLAGIGVLGFVAHNEELATDDRILVGTAGVLALASGLTGMIIGGHKTSTCERARRRWDEAKRTVERDLAIDLEARVYTLGDTLVVDSPSPTLCATPGWFVRVQREQARLLDRGLVRASCRVAGVEVERGSLDTPGIN